MGALWDGALVALGARLGQAGLQHSLRTAETAGELAMRYGVDVENARLAGLLHDWCKDEHGSALLARAPELGIPVTETDRAVPYLLHAPVAAAELRRAFPEIPEDVIGAIGAHTYGGGAMSRLDMVLYIADTIEPGRQHAGAVALRELIGAIPLEELFIRTYAESLRYLIDSRRRIHPSTVATWNKLVGGAS